MLGTSKAKHDNKEFDLFITTAPMPDLNEKLNVFGRVILGEDVAQVTHLRLSVGRSVDSIYYLLRMIDIDTVYVLM